MSKKNIIQVLKNRGLIQNVINENLLMNELSNNNSINLYCGFDPTSDSLHLGHLIPLLCIKHFLFFKHKVLIIIGGSTGLIGDPSFRNIERYDQVLDKIQSWTKKIKIQINNFFKNDINNIKILNNYQWFNSTNLVDFLCDIGKYFSINQMIKKDIVKNRLFNKKNSLSFKEFSYNILQGYDFFYLYENYNVVLQIGGNDQWSNIISGINLINKKRGKVVYGITVPLMTKKNGIKFSKTDSDIIWLDPNKTSPYKFYQFWVNINDDDVYKFLKMFTFINLYDLKKIKNNFNLINNIISAKIILAEEITKIVHGIDGLISAKRITNCLFSNKIFDLKKEDIIQLSQDDIPKCNVSHGLNLQQALILSRLALSKNQARKMIISGAISINGNKQTFKDYVFHENDKLYGSFTFLRRGKKQHYLLCWENNSN